MFERKSHETVLGFQIYLPNENIEIEDLLWINSDITENIGQFDIKMVKIMERFFVIWRESKKNQKVITKDSQLYLNAKNEVCILFYFDFKVVVRFLYWYISFFFLGNATGLGLFSYYKHISKIFNVYFCSLLTNIIICIHKQNSGT